MLQEKIPHEIGTQTLYNPSDGAPLGHQSLLYET